MEGRIHDYCTNKHDTNKQTVRVGFLCCDDGETETRDNRNWSLDKRKGPEIHVPTNLSQRGGRLTQSFAHEAHTA